jgi:hypothetical protein
MDCCVGHGTATPSRHARVPMRRTRTPAAMSQKDCTTYWTPSGRMKRMPAMIPEHPEEAGEQADAHRVEGDEDDAEAEQQAAELQHGLARDERASRDGVVRRGGRAVAARGEVRGAATMLICRTSTPDGVEARGDERDDEREPAERRVAGLHGPVQEPEEEADPHEGERLHDGEEQDLRGLLVEEQHRGRQQPLRPARQRLAQSIAQAVEDADLRDVRQRDAREDPRHDEQDARGDRGEGAEAALAPLPRERLLGRLRLGHRARHRQSVASGRAPAWTCAGSAPSLRRGGT